MYMSLSRQNDLQRQNRLNVAELPLNTKIAKTIEVLLFDLQGRILFYYTL